MNVSPTTRTVGTAREAGEGFVNSALFEVLAAST